MAKVHVYPVGMNHVTGPGGCWCEPKILDLGLDMGGEPARVFVHDEKLSGCAELEKKLKKEETPRATSMSA